MLQAPAKTDQKAKAREENKEEEEKGAAEWLCSDSKDACDGVRAIRDAVKCSPVLCSRICAARRLSLYGGRDSDFHAVLCVLRNTLECKAATEALLAYFGGDKPHDGARSVCVSLSN